MRDTGGKAIVIVMVFPTNAVFKLLTLIIIFGHSSIQCWKGVSFS